MEAPPRQFRPLKGVLQAHLSAVIEAQKMGIRPHKKITSASRTVRRRGDYHALPVAKISIVFLCQVQGRREASRSSRVLIYCMSPKHLLGSTVPIAFSQSWDGPRMERKKNLTTMHLAEDLLARAREALFFPFLPDMP